jgi:replicative DNA helicase
MRYLSSIVSTSDAQALNTAPVEDLTEDEGAAFDNVRRFFSQYNHFPTVETMQERGIRLPDAPESLGYYRDEVFNQIRVRRAALLIQELQPALETRDGIAAQDIVQQFRMANSDPELGFQSYSAAMPTILDRFTPEGTAGAVRPTGLAAIDDTLGGVRRGGLWAVAGRPGLGKTFIQVAACVGLIQMRERVLYISKELSVEEMQDRILTLSTGANPGLGTRRMASSFLQDILRERVVHALQGRDDNLYFANSEAVNTPSDIEALIAECNPTQVLIDGTYFLKPTDFNVRDSRTERYEKLVRELQQLGRRTQRTIGVTWQQNRSGAAGTEGLYGSDALSQDASLVLMMKKYKRHPDMRGLWVAKNRHGPDNLEIGVNFGFRPTDIGSVCDVPEDNRGQRSESRRSEHVARAISEAGTGGRAPGAESVGS